MTEYDRLIAALDDFTAARHKNVRATWDRCKAAHGLGAKPHPAPPPVYERWFAVADTVKRGEHQNGRHRTYRIRSDGSSGRYWSKGQDKEPATAYKTFARAEAAVAAGYLIELDPATGEPLKASQSKSEKAMTIEQRVADLEAVVDILKRGERALAEYLKEASCTMDLKFTGLRAKHGVTPIADPAAERDRCFVHAPSEFTPTAELERRAKGEAAQPAKDTDIPTLWRTDHRTIELRSTIAGLEVKLKRMTAERDAALRPRRAKAKKKGKKGAGR